MLWRWWRFFAINDSVGQAATLVMMSSGWCTGSAGCWEVAEDGYLIVAKMK